MRSVGQPIKIIPNDWRGEDQSVNTVEHSAVTGQKRAGVFHSGAALVGGLEQISGLTCDICERGHGD